MKHTSGPWRIVSRNPLSFTVNSIETDGGIGNVVCWFGANSSAEENLANARLVAAAPELLDILVRIVDEGLTIGKMNVARAAIAKATEES